MSNEMVHQLFPSNPKLNVDCVIAMLSLYNLQKINRISGSYIRYHQCHTHHTDTMLVLLMTANLKVG